MPKSSTMSTVYLEKNNTRTELSHSSPLYLIEVSVWRPLAIRGECVHPTFQGSLYLAHPPQQMIRPKATDGQLRTDKTFISRAKKGPKHPQSDGVAWDSPVASSVVNCATPPEAKTTLISLSVFVRIDHIIKHSQLPDIDPKRNTLMYLTDHIQYPYFKC